MHFILPSYGTVTVARDNRSGGNVFSGSLKSYNLFNSQTTDKHFTNCKKHLLPTILMYSNEITVVGIDPDVDNRKNKLQIYQLHKKDHLYSWELFICSTFRVHPHLLEQGNVVCISYENDGVAVISIVNQLTTRDPHKMTVLLFSSQRVGGRYWRYTTITLTDLQCDRFKIKSCVAISNYIYCSLMVQESAVYIYEINLTTLKLSSKEANDSSLPKHMWAIESLSLKNCFLSALNEKLILITFADIKEQTCLEVRQFSNPICEVPAPAFQFLFPYLVTAVTASIVSGIQNTIVVVYHDNKLKKCLVKCFTL